LAKATEKRNGRSKKCRLEIRCIGVVANFSIPQQQGA
jgi:hypothetical protein